MRQFISSMSAKGYEQYGKTFIERAQECLPGEVIVYTADEVPANETRVIWRNLNEVSGFTWFLDATSRFPVMNGNLDGSGRQNYRYNLVKFCHKCFAQIDAAASNQDEMWWIDADIEFDKPIPADFFDKQLQGVFMTYLGRPKWHCCASLLGFNNKHKQAAEFWAVYMSLFVTGTVFLMQEWHDSYWIDKLRTDLHLLARNMAGELPHQDGPFNVFDAVMGEYAHHKKGNLKNTRPQPSNRYEQLLELVRERKPQRILEIGTWNGGRALQMNAVSTKSEYFGFDLFEEATEETDRLEKNVKQHSTAESVGRLLAENGVVYQLYGGNTKATLPMYLEKYGPASADFIFIDGGHSYETIKSDLNYCRQIVQKGGIIVLDDYYTDMPEDELRQFGCQNVLADLGIAHKLLSKADPVKGGGYTQMAVIEC